MTDIYTRSPQLTAPLRVKRKSVASAELKKLQRRTLSADSRLPTLFATLALPPTPCSIMSTAGSPPKEVSQLPPDEQTTPESPERDVEALILELRSSLSASQTLLHSQTQRLTKMANLETELSVLKDQHAFVTAAKEAVEKDLQQEKKRREAAEETVEMLRGQVEQARRGVGMLQKQEKDRKRMSQIPHIPAGGFAAMEESSEEAVMEKETSKASKRTSFIGARKTSSNSEPDSHSIAGSSRPTPFTSPNPDMPKTGGLRELRLGSLVHPPSSSGAAGSSFSSSPIGTHFEEVSYPIPPMGHRTPSSSTVLSNTQLSPPKAAGVSDEEAASLRLELRRVKSQLAESEESRIASEACLKALREFMASGGEGEAPPNELLREMRLPPLPSDVEPGMEETNVKKSSGSGWGFKLWRGGAQSSGGGGGPASSPASTMVEPPGSPESEKMLPSAQFASTPKIGTSGSPLPTPGDLPVEGAVQAVPTSQTPLASFVSGWTKGVVPGTPVDRPSAPGRKLTSFFSRGNAKKDETESPVVQDTIEGEASQAEDADGKGAAAELEPSPDIVDLTEGAEDKRASGTTGSGTEDVIGTPKGSPEVQTSKLSPDVKQVDVE
ncbi:hypothetical protein BD324DRAFT_636869 [Kockovaella imperatae]|uniref:Uncharacterized protein n=1 Tax=Kockovaella imperatae TaxID=4999 RepID=A0A1Y1U9D5_9TREE|nr:hypothetical protein BD324DRAFT_636869 [Kockovaella imperatae]ORX34154.1 hypothetical protein BD324DRAFT_636869 [Kockovaella imperatae]